MREMNEKEMFVYKEEVELVCDRCKNQTGYVIFDWKKSLKQYTCPHCKGNELDDIFLCSRCARIESIHGDDKIFPCDSCNKELGCVMIYPRNTIDLMCSTCNTDFQNMDSKVSCFCKLCRMNQP